MYLGSLGLASGLDFLLLRFSRYVVFGGVEIFVFQSAFRGHIVDKEDKLRIFKL